MAQKYHAEVIGSMLRPQYLKDARKAWEAKTLSTWEFKRVEDRAVDEMITLQDHCGVDVVTDGEMRRTHFIAPLTDVITGVKAIPAGYVPTAIVDVTEPAAGSTIAILFVGLAT